MTLSADEKTTHDGRPRELYKFEMDGATSRYYTSAGENITFDGDTYTNVAIERGPIISEPFGDTPGIEVNLPFSLGVVTDLLFKIPPRGTRLTIYRSHADTLTKVNTRAIWIGLITNCRANGRVVTITSESLLAATLGVSVPLISIQQHCNHVLYDARCGVDRSSYDQAATVSTVSGNTITVSTVGGAADDTFNGGFVKRNSDGEVRTIVDQAGTTIILLRAFHTLSPTNAVTLYQGCDHLRDTCHSKFNNLVNFGGHPDIRAGRPDKMGVYGHGGE